MCDCQRGQLSGDSLLVSWSMLRMVVHEPLWLEIHFCDSSTSILESQSVGVEEVFYFVVLRQVAIEPTNRSPGAGSRMWKAGAPRERT